MIRLINHQFRSICAIRQLFYNCYIKFAPKMFSTIDIYRQNPWQSITNSGSKVSGIDSRQTLVGESTHLFNRLVDVVSAECDFAELLEKNSWKKSIMKELGLNSDSVLSLLFAEGVSSSLIYREYEELLLMTVQNARHLSHAQVVILLAICRNFMPASSNEKIFDILFRLINVQLMEMSAMEILGVCCTLEGFSMKSEEKSLLLSEIETQIVGRRYEFEELGLAPFVQLLLSLTDDILLEKSAQKELLASVASLGTSRRHSRTLLVITKCCELMARFKTVNPILIRQTFSSAQRLVNRQQGDTPGKHERLASLFTCLANLCTGWTPSANAVTANQKLSAWYNFRALCQQQQQAGEALERDNAFVGLDWTWLCMTDWIRQVLADAFEPSETIMQMKASSLANAVVALCVLGHRPDSLMEAMQQLLPNPQLQYALQVANLLVARNDSVSYTSQLLARSDELDPKNFVLEEFNATPLDSQLESAVDKLLRPDWQLYYKLAYHAHTNGGILSSMQDMVSNELFEQYVRWKADAVDSVMHMIEQRMAPLELEVFPFHEVQLANGSRVFGDLVFRARSRAEEGKYKYAVCLVPHVRDVLTPRPFSSVLGAYQSTWRAQRLPLPMTVLLSNRMDEQHVLKRRRDDFLIKLAFAWQKSPGFAAEAASCVKFNE